MKQRRNEPSFKDPVCGMEISRSTAMDECKYRGMTYYFCAGICREAFEAEPGKYIAEQRKFARK